LIRDTELGAATAQQQAYLYLQDQIVSGVLTGGTRLRADAIASALGISRMPVREAIRQLDAEGYVTIRPNRSAIVTNRTPEQVLELCEIRAVLEGLAFRLAIPNVTQSALEELSLMASTLRRPSSDYVRLVQRHDDFHEALCRLSQRPRLCTEIRHLRLAVQPYVRLYTKTHGTPERVGYEHDTLLELLRKGDPDRAERAMREHIMVNAEGIASSFTPLLQETSHPVAL
jgi:DNA-binding GntR family transcriptional regulator